MTTNNITVNASQAHLQPETQAIELQRLVTSLHSTHKVSMSTGSRVDTK